MAHLRLDAHRQRGHYLVGVPWLKAAVGVAWSHAVSLGFTPFLAGDLLKAALAAGIFTIAWRGIDRRTARKP